MIRVPTIYEINDLRFHNKALYREILKHKTWAYDDFIQDISGFDRDEIDMDASRCPHCTSELEK